MLRFEDAYERHVNPVYAFFLYRVGSRELAEDLTQMTFERALRAWSRFDPARASPRTWLFSIARNLLIDHYRGDRAATLEHLDEALSERLQGADTPSVGIEPWLERALDELAPRDREVIALRFGADLTGADIAELTGLSLSNVQQVLSRSLRRLRRRGTTTSDEE